MRRSNSEEMEAPDVFLQELTVDGNCCYKTPPNANLNRKLFRATRDGDLEKFRSLTQGKCDLNLVNNCGKTLLQVASDLKDVSARNEIIEALLSGGANLELALLHAVHDRDAKTVELLLLFHNPGFQASTRPLLSFKSQGYITPLILAAWLQNFQIVKLLLDHGFTISDPNIPHWPTDPNVVAGEKLGPAVCRLNGYRALASPVYIAALFLQNIQTGPDPIHNACVMSKELNGIAEKDYEFRKEYLELSDGCKEFAVALLDECRSMKEIKCAMEMTTKGEIVLAKMDRKSLNILEFAISTRNEKFVGHPYSQLALNSEVYKNVPFLEKSSWKQALLILLASVLSPLIFIVWLVCDVCFPSHKVTTMFHSPCAKFLISCGSYQTFLFLLAFTSFHSTGDFLEYSIIDWVVLLFVIGLLVDVIKDLYQQGKARFCSYHWNYLAVACVTSFAVHYVIWWAGRASIEKEASSMKWETHAKDRGYAIILASYSLFALGILLAFAQNLSYIQANSSTGPLLHAFIKMLMDVAKFFFYFVFVFLAFAVSFTKLYLQYDKARKHFLLSQSAANETDPLLLERFGSSMGTIFWTLFGLIDQSSFQIDVHGYGAIWKTGMVLFGTFNIVAVLVALNMLIAILNESYTRITENLDTEWKFTRTKLWLQWIHKKGVLPPPFNFLYILLPLRWLGDRLFTLKHCPETFLIFSRRFINAKPETAKKVRIDEKERREVIRHLLLRYLAKKSCKTEAGTELSDSERENENEMNDTKETETPETNL